MVIAWFDGLLKRSTVNEILFLTTLQNSFHYKYKTLKNKLDMVKTFDLLLGQRTRLTRLNELPCRTFSNLRLIRTVIRQCQTR